MDSTSKSATVGEVGHDGRFDSPRFAKTSAIVEGRRRFGDWEGDLVEGGTGTGAIATLVERKSRYRVAKMLAGELARLDSGPNLIWGLLNPIRGYPLSNFLHFKL